jgi:hypothetical protein
MTTMLLTEIRPCSTIAVVSNKTKKLTKTYCGEAGKAAKRRLLFAKRVVSGQSLLRTVSAT